MVCRGIARVNLPERAVPLSQEQADRVKQALKRHWENATCEVCGSSEWGTGGQILQLRELKGDEPTTVVPVLAIHCKTCGNTKLASAIALGLIDPVTGERTSG
jgi:hypothetical protein